MGCPFELPVEKVQMPKNSKGIKLYRIDKVYFPYTEDEADYIVQAINGHEKLVRVIEEINQCFKCKFGYRQQALNCPGEADAELPCEGFIEEHKGLNYLERALKEAEKP